MKTITIINHTEHPFRFDHCETFADGSVHVDPKRAIVIPRGGVPRNSEDGAFIPGRLEVDETALERLKKDDVAQHWFKLDSGGRPQLTVEEKPEKPAKPSPAKAA